MIVVTVGAAPTVNTTPGETAPPVFSTEMSAVPAVATCAEFTIATRSLASWNDVLKGVVVPPAVH